jgi:hypothetical protein
MMTKLPIEQIREAIANPEVFAGCGIGWAGGGRSGRRAGSATVVRWARGAEALANGAEVPGFGTVKEV